MMWVCCWCRAECLSECELSPVKHSTIIVAAFYGHSTQIFFIHRNITSSLQRPDLAPLTSVEASAQAPEVTRIKSLEEL